jgi:type VI secretion system secreted protein VgrG
MAAENVHEVLEVQIDSRSFSCERLRVHRLSGKEAISRLFRFEVDVVSLDHDGASATAEDMAGGSVTLTFVRAGIELRRIHGMIAQVHDLFTSEAGHRSFRLVVVPLAFRLTLIETSDIFMKMTVPQILQRKFDLVRLTDEMELRLTGTYPEREFVVQYNEPDLTFASRLAEHVGISFYFDHSGDRDKIVFTDHAAGFVLGDDTPEIRYRTRGEERDVFELSAATSLVPGYYAVRDHNYRTPQIDLTSEFQLPVGTSGGAIEYGGHFKTPEEGVALARVRAEERQTSQLVYTGRSDVPELGAGGVYTLEGHPDLDSPKLLITEIEHQGTFVVGGAGPQGKTGYLNSFRAIPAERTFRPARTTPRPQMTGFITGIIEPLAPGAHRLGAIDEQGRYVVRFLFDTTAPGERQASRPVRMLQQHAGENYGTHFPLRPGTEVLIGFVNGDPDRPVIVGAVPNPQKPSPVNGRHPGLHRIKTETGIMIDMLEEP